MRIFINYRRKDQHGGSGAFVGRLKDRLEHAFGQGSIFVDEIGIRPGERFPSVLEKEVMTADILLAVIGGDWLKELRESEDEDFVVQEIDFALRQGIAVVPILVNDTAMPKASDLPDCIKGLSELNAHNIHQLKDFDYHVEQLISYLRSEEGKAIDNEFLHLPSMVENLVHLDSSDLIEVLSCFSNLIACFDQERKDDLQDLLRERSYLEYLWERIESQDKNVPIYGTPGSGKSTLIALLAIYARYVRHLHCEYLNLQHYEERLDWNVGKVEVGVELNRRVERIRKLGAEADFYLFIDGFHDSESDISRIQRNLESQIEAIPGIHIVGCTKQDDNDSLSSRSAPVKKQLKTARFSIDLEPVPFPLPDHVSPVVRFCELSKLLEKKKLSSYTCSADWLSQRAEKAEIRHIDLLRLIMLAETTCDSEKGIGGVLEEYARNQVTQSLRNGEAEEDAKQELLKAAGYVHKRELSGNYSILTPPDLRCLGLLTRHHLLRSFCQAYYVIFSLAQLGKRANVRSKESKIEIEKEWKQAGLDGLIFPDLTNMLCKHLLIANSDSIIDAIKAIIDVHLEKVKQITSEKESADYFKQLASYATEIIHLSYLLGRFVRRVDEAENILGNIYDAYFANEIYRASRFEDNMQRGDFAKLRMLHATVLISQVLITKRTNIKKEKSEQFLLLLRDSEWRDIVCGFHLEYYGDVPFSYDVTKHFADKKDTLEPFTKMLDAIEDRLVRSLKYARPHDLFNIEMGIVCAMANARQQAQDLKWTKEQLACRTRVRNILGMDMHSRLKKEPVVPYMRMSEKFLRTESANSAFSMLSKLYEMKFDTLRSGWITKLEINGRIESVADHSWSAMLLAEALLPNDPPPGIEENYSKDRIIRTLLIHDISEAITGDRPLSGPSANREGSHEREEKYLSEMFGWVNTLNGVMGFDELTKKWSDAEMGAPVNGRIARLFDKLDALYQLTIYAKMVQARGEPIQSKEELGSEWAEFFEALAAEAEEVANGLPDYFKDMSYQWIEWARREFENGLPYLQHEEMFMQTQKYYPRQKKHLQRGKGIWRDF